MDKKMLIKEIEKILDKEILNSNSDFKLDAKHIEMVRKYALMLAKQLNADEFVVEVAALLHDIGRIKYGGDKHEVTGAEESVKILEKFGCETEFINKVKNVILTHRGDSEFKPKLLAEKIVACADAMTHFDTIADLFIEFYKLSKSVDKAKEILRGKLGRAWTKASRLPEAKAMVKDKYEAAMLLFK